MSIENNHKFKKEILRLSLFLGELMLSSGAETYRVEDSILRICKSRGFYHVNVFTTPTVIIISDDRFDGYAFMKVIKQRSINLNKVATLNTFSRKFVENTNMSVDDAIQELSGLDFKSPYNPYILNIATAIGSASFAVLAGGDDSITFVLTLITSILAILTFNKIMKVSGIPAFSTLVSSVFIALSGILLTRLEIISSPKMLIVGSIMPLLPGVPFIKGLNDLISGDLISGITRAFDAFITAIAIACGVGVILNIYFKMGGAL